VCARIGHEPTEEEVERSAKHLELADLAERRVKSHEARARNEAARKASPVLLGVPASFLRLPEFECVPCTPDPWNVVINGNGELVRHPNDGRIETYQHHLTSRIIFERTFAEWLDGPQRGQLAQYAPFLDKWRAALDELSAERLAVTLASEQSDRELLARLGAQMADILPAVLPELGDEDRG
jgi:hypothetical protein